MPKCEEWNSNEKWWNFESEPSVFHMEIAEIVLFRNVTEKSTLKKIILDFCYLAYLRKLASFNLYTNFAT